MRPHSQTAYFCTCINVSKPTGYVMHHQLTFNNCTLCPHCIYVFCIYLRTNSDLCHLQHKLIGFYNRDGKCLQRGTDWVFKYSILLVGKGLIWPTKATGLLPKFLLLNSLQAPSGLSASPKRLSLRTGRFKGRRLRTRSRYGVRQSMGHLSVVSSSVGTLAACLNLQNF